MSNNKEKCDLWMSIRRSRGIVDIYDLGLAQDVFSECYDTLQSELAKRNDEIKMLQAKWDSDNVRHAREVVEKDAVIAEALKYLEKFMYRGSCMDEKSYREQVNNFLQQHKVKGERE